MGNSNDSREDFLKTVEKPAALLENRRWILFLNDPIIYPGRQPVYHPVEQGECQETSDGAEGEKPQVEQVHQRQDPVKEREGEPDVDPCSHQR